MLAIFPPKKNDDDIAKKILPIEGKIYEKKSYRLRRHEL
jgi:hypothetical protein